MAETALTPVALAINAASASTTDAGGGATATTQADGWAVAIAGAGIVPADPTRLLMKFVDDGGGGTTITVKAGDLPGTSALGDLTFALGASEVKYIWVEPARFIRKAAGDIHVISSDNGTRCAAFLLARG